MDCIARVTAHGGIRACGRPTQGDTSYCDEHADRPLIHAERLARHAEIASRIARQRKLSTLPAPIHRTRTQVHSSLDAIVDYIDSVEYYGRTAHDTALAMLDAYSASINRKVLDNTINGFELGAIERDIDRLIQRSRGKLLASAQRMQARDHTGTRKHAETRSASNTSRTLSLSDIRIARAHV